MISELQSLPPEKMQQALQSVTEFLLPHPDERPMNEVDIKLLSAITASLGFSATNLSGANLAKVFEFLSKSLAQPYLTERTIPVIRARLGDRGTLSPRQYKFEFEPFLLLLAKRTGVRPAHIEDSVYHSDSYQHLSPEIFGLETHRFPSISLFVSTRRGESADPYSLLVQCVRQADKLTAWEAWRIYHKDTNTSESTAPLNLLKAFVNTYGMDFTIEDSAPSKFILYDVFSLKSSGSSWRFSTTYQPNEWGKRSGFVRPNKLGSVEVSFFYIISVPRYLASLSKRGISVDVSRPNQQELQSYSHDIWP